MTSASGIAREDAARLKYVIGRLLQHHHITLGVRHVGVEHQRRELIACPDVITWFAMPRNPHESEELTLGHPRVHARPALYRSSEIESLEAASDPHHVSPNTRPDEPHEAVVNVRLLRGDDSGEGAHEVLHPARP